MIFPKLHIELERWKWNEEFGLYVSTFGNFKDKNRKEVKPKTFDGYLWIKNQKKAGSVGAHRVVMLTWHPIDNPNEMTVDHLDHNKRNNRLSNLEWVSKVENLRRAQEDELRGAELKVSIERKTLEHFYYIVNGQTFTTIKDAFLFTKTQGPYLEMVNLQEMQIQKVYEKLVNAFNHKNSEYVNNGYVKEKYNCKFSIIEKGA
jgi:hypothetical protein